ncbi:2-methylaconitate cis-trans isomerase PrpF family protein [uncultured Alsobacter sp.]|uniref:2-methylaconitate cis-trans isomerase PrpF family protein n=1 Tax=uncultured Alsobacter sp. TaxID=1748258 RepID=UPI0025FF8659|nr:PrpF domain-containing protein [uncultured Alsobacter sp.]
MTQRFIPCVFYRGGTSKGMFFHPHDLPAERSAIDRILLAAIGSPDPYGRQLDGMGGGISSLSKAVIIGPSTHPEADVDYTFVQLAVDEPVADWTNNCGNLSSAVGHFAVDEGLVPATDGEVLVRIHQTNTRKLIHSRFTVKGGKAETRGDFVIAGVAGTGSRVRLDFLDPAGAVTGRLLPSGRPVDTLTIGPGETVEATLIDATSPIVYVEASVVGLDGTESPDAIEATPGVMERLERIRRAGGVAMGLGATPAEIGLQTPRVGIVAAPRDFTSLDGARVSAADFDIATRMLSMGRAHRAIPGTAGLNLGVATQVPGTIPHRVSRPASVAGEVRVANPSGLVSVGAVVREGVAGWTADSAVLFRTARRLMQGAVAVPDDL